MWPRAPEDSQAVLSCWSPEPGAHPWLWTDLIRLRRPISVPVERLRVEVDDDVLGLGVEIHGVPAQLAAETALLVAAEGRLGRVDRRVVDADVAGLKSARQDVGALDVVGPDRRRQTVDRGVGGLDDLVLGGEGDHRQHGTEDFLLRSEERR